MNSNEGWITTPDGVRLFFRTAGSGPKITLIPNGMYFYDDFKVLADSRTLVFYDVRNRGYSDAISDSAKLSRGVYQDVDDLEAVRAHFGAHQVELIGHSYIGLMAALYAVKHPEHVARVLQISPSQPDAATQYPAHLAYTDDVMPAVFSRIGQMQKEARPEDPAEACRQFWSVLRAVYVADPADAGKIDWGRCDLPNERNFMKYWTVHISPSLQNVHLDAQQLAPATMPVLVIHGTMDRSAPYGGARDWAMMLPNARLLTLRNVAHAPWIEAPEPVFAAIRDFLDGRWPESAGAHR